MQPPPREPSHRPSELVELTTLDSTLRLDIRYASAANFLGRRLYDEARAFLQRPAAEALVRVHRALAADGLGLLVHDGYRPWHVTKLLWDATPEDKHMFVANPARGSRHNRGCAVDVSLFHRASGAPAQMPSAYDEMTERARVDYSGGAAEARRLRDLLVAAMSAERFAVYENEWWHFDYEDWMYYAVEDVTFAQADAGSRDAASRAVGST